ncbi:hypothetical protein AWB68_07721 [Caballeronia choica]|uniref:Uncharacterized protein n=1 Tax=Caballeronia choica TaxID=326476 RepID=A0A158KWK2_9BURK|nr:hypothetical protein AWB68_07721 [Caballeronia choica]
MVWMTCDIGGGTVALWSGRITPGTVWSGFVRRVYVGMKRPVLAMRIIRNRYP